MNFFDEITDDERVKQYKEPDEWYRQRVGRFTGSEIHKLMTFGKRPMTKAELDARPKTGKGSQTTQVPDSSKFSDTARTYIYSKVAEVLTNQPKPEIYAYQLFYGKQTEPEAIEYFETVNGLKTEIIGFVEYTDHAGATPDRMISGAKEGLEMKCPIFEKHIEYLMLTDQYDLKANFLENYWQCLMEMMVTNSDRWHFAAYHPMFPEKQRLFHMIIESKSQDIQDDMDLIRKAIEGAVKEKLAVLQILNQNQNES